MYHSTESNQASIHAFSLKEAIGRANPRSLDDLAKLVWRGLAQASLSEAEAAELAAEIEAKRTLKRAQPSKRSPYRPRPITSDRIKRRRQQAARVSLPDSCSLRYTPGESAVMSVVLRLIKRDGRIEKPLDEIGDLAGVCRRTVQRAIRCAVAFGQLRVQERRVSYDRNDTNLIELGDDPDLIRWLKRGELLSAGRGVGDRAVTPYGEQINKGRKTEVKSSKRAMASHSGRRSRLE